jgi:hypothetical protein
VELDPFRPSVDIDRGAPHIAFSLMLTNIAKTRFDAVKTSGISERCPEFFREGDGSHRAAASLFAHRLCARTVYRVPDTSQ